jgi:plastocyanin
MMRPTILLATLGLVAIAIAGFSIRASSASAETVTINTGNFYFCDASHNSTPCTTTINVGDTVNWFAFGGSHEVQECDDETFTSCTGFDLGIFSTGDTRSHTFDTAGDVYYHCALHDNMKGEIEVEALATDTPSPTPAASASASPTAAPTAAAVPQTGGPLGDAGNAWEYALLAVGAMLVAGSGAAFVVARKR